MEAAPIDTRTTLERLADTIDELQRMAWADAELDREELREGLSEAMGLACKLLDDA